MDPPQNSDLIDPENNIKDNEINYEHEYNKLMIENAFLKGKLVLISKLMDSITNIENNTKKISNKLSDMNISINQQFEISRQMKKY